MADKSDARDASEKPASDPGGPQQHGKKAVLGLTLLNVLDSLPFYAMLVDSSHHILFANKAVREHLKVEPGEIEGRYCPKAVHGLDHPYPGCPLEIAVEAGGVAIENEQYDENYCRWFSLAVYPTGCQTAEGHDIYFHIVQDISEKKEAQRAQWESENKYRQIIEETKDIVCIGDVSGRITDINPAGLHSLGYSSVEEIRAIDYIKDLYFNPEDHEDIMRLMTEHGSIEDYEVDLKKRDGSRITVMTSVTAVRDEDGRIVELRAIMRDITEHKLLEQQLFHAQRLEAVGRLAGGIAHDFNNFLTAIQGYSLLMLKELPQDNPFKENLEEILKTTNRAADLTRQLLLFGRSEDLDLQPVNLDDIIDGTHAMLKQLIGVNYRITMRKNGDDLNVKADPVQLQQILMNLVINARDAMPAGGDITISSKCIDVDSDFLARNPKAVPGKAACISVADEGTGIPEEYLEKVFDPFFTTKKAGKGTGLGLAVVHGIVSKHGGWIDIESSGEKGTIFSFCLPVSGEAVEQPVILDDDADAAAAGDGQLILVVEDDESVQNIVKRMLSQHGFNVTAAGSAEEALELVSAGEVAFDLVFSDIVLPQVNGLALARKLRESNPKLKVLLTSGYAGDTIGVDALGREGFRMLQKPYTLVELVQAVNKALHTN